MRWVASSLRLWLPYRVLPMDRSGSSRLRQRLHLSVAESSLATRARTFRGFVPYRVFPAWGSAITKRFPYRFASAVVTPSGFRTLSTFCSPPDLPGLFHPDPASGVHPSGFCSTTSAVRVSQPACTLLRFRARQYPSANAPEHFSGSAPPGLCSLAAGSYRGVGISPYLRCCCPLGLSSPRHFPLRPSG
jgi:hypothetical protein